MTAAQPFAEPRRQRDAVLDYGIAPPAYRLPAETRLGRVVLQIADLELTLAYYQNVLGLRVLEREPQRAVLGPQGDDRAIVELRERLGARPVPSRGHLGLYHFAVLLPNRAALGRFLAHLRNLGERAGMSDHLVSEALYLTDPDGLGIEVYADRPRSSWRARDGQLVMATEPLDVADLLTAANGEPWTGAPAGTTLGHVHLYVGDVARAADFYHRGLGLDQVVWSYPGALFLSAGGYHHHLGVNTWARGAAPAGEDDARLVEWEVLLPSAGDAAAAIDSLAGGSVTVERTPDGGLARDPWGTAVRVRVAA